MRRNFDEGISEIKKIKESIYEGYKLNLLLYDDKLKSYICKQTGVPVELYSKILESIPGQNLGIPKKIITSSITLSGKDTPMFTFKGGFISILDGYVNVDIGFID